MLLRTEPDLPGQIAANAGGSLRVAIIGGGFAGASIARCLALSGRTAPGGIVVFEPRQRLGAGLAYDVCDPALRLNVAAHRMRALPGQPDAFADFLNASGRLACDRAAFSGAEIYARRADFAAFMQDAMEPHLSSGAIKHRRARVTELCRDEGEWRIRSDAGDSLGVDAVIIAIGHPQASLPKTLTGIAAADTRVLRDPNCIGQIGENERVLIIGAGLTALDYMAALDERRHKGPITLLCRTGLLPQAQAPMNGEPFGEFLAPQLHSTIDLLRAVRNAIGAAQAKGQSWHCVFDALRKQGQPIWQSLPEAEKARFLRHVRRRYETHRFRMPPQNEALLARLKSTGQLVSLAGQVGHVDDVANAFHAEIAIKGTDRRERQTFDRIAIATGPEQRVHFSTQPWLAALVAEGEAAPAPLGLGIACDTSSRVTNAEGTVSPGLFVIGPPTRATFGEITGAPEIAAQAAAVAGEIIAAADGVTRRITA